MSRYFGIPLRNGLPLGLGSVASLRSGASAAWSPLALFSGGQQGGWYDGEDITTMFQDSAGTTPVTGVEQPVGLWLDKRLGALTALGSELLTNGDGSTTAGWVYSGGSGGGVASVGGQLVFTSASALTALADRLCRTEITGLTTGRTYRLSCVARNISDSVGVRVSVAPAALASDTSGTYADVSATSLTSIQVIFVATDTVMFLRLIARAGTSLGQVAADNISVREVPGNHLIQPTSASRPTYSRRYNLLERTQDFANAYWDKTRTTVSAATDPIGGATAWKLINDSTPASSHQIRRTVTVTSGQSYTVRFLAKAAEYAFVRFWEDATTGHQCSFDLTTGVATSAGVSSCSMTSAGDGWWICTAVLNSFGGTSFGYRLNLTPDGTTTNYNGDGVSGVFLAWPDLRRTLHTTMGMPAYQRVATATDYEQAGFLPRLRFDGADDSMYTAASVNFSASDQVSVIAGVAKLSDAAIGIVAELSANFNSENGSFYIAAPELTGASGNFSSNLRGSTAPAGAITSGTVLAPAGRVLTVLSEINPSVRTMRVNSVETALSTQSQGTGNFGNHVLFVGRRNNASLPFNGDIFQLIIRGALTSGADLSSAEQYVAQRTGVTI